MFDLTTASLLAPTFVLLLIFWKFVRSRQKGIPGPFWAHLTDFYRVSLVWSGDCASKIQHLHNIYGPVVRTGPNHVVVSDPAAMFMIYGQGVKFKKVDLSTRMKPIDACMTSLLTKFRPTFIAYLPCSTMERRLTLFSQPEILGIIKHSRCRLPRDSRPLPYVQQNQP